MAKITSQTRKTKTTNQGDILTERDMEAISTEAEAGYELSQAKRQRLGRPSLDSGISPRVSFRTSHALYEAARERASREGRSVSELAREAMERYVRN